MYIYIYEIPEKFLKPSISKKVSHYGTLCIFTEKSPEVKRGQESYFWREIRLV